MGTKLELLLDILLQSRENGTEVRSKQPNTIVYKYCTCNI